MKKHTKLQTILKKSFHLQAQRITAMTYFTLAVIKTRSVDYTQLSLAMNQDVEPESNLRRIQRLIDEVTLSAADKHVFVMQGRKKVNVSFDRTEWDFGSVTNNLLTSAVECGSLAVPVQITDLGKCGSSNDNERIQAITDTLKVIPACDMKVFTADREFPSERVLNFSIKQKIPFSMRLKANALIEHNEEVKPASEWFKGYKKRILRNATVYGVIVNVCGRRLAKGKKLKGKAKRKPKPKNDFLIVLTTLEPLVGFDLYKSRWKVETLFGALKTRGFNLEKTRVTISKHLTNLVLLLGIALLWAVQTGVWVVSRGSVRVRRDGVRFLSVFRAGLDFLRRLLFRSQFEEGVWDDVVRVLSAGFV